MPSSTMERVRTTTGRVRNRIEQLWLKRWYAAPRMRGTKLDLRVDVSGAGAQARAEATFSFRPQVRSTRTVCVIGDVKLHAARWGDRPVAARVNPPFLVMTFPKPLEAFVETTVNLRYSYVPDMYGTLLQPVTKDDMVERVTVTCRRPLRAVVQGKLVQATENPPTCTYVWDPPRSRRLNLVLCDGRSFRKETPEGMALWLHAARDGAERAPRILDLVAELFHQASESNHRKLPYTDFHVVESLDSTSPAFNSPGMIVVPHGTFRTDDKPTVTGVLAPELNKEWRRDPTRMVATGTPDSFTVRR
jgi:hypothetical protein